MNNLELITKPKNELKIRELIEILKDINNPEAIIMLASDKEGSSFGNIQKITEQNTSKKGKTIHILFPIDSFQNEEIFQK